MKTDRICEAPYHVADCSGFGESEDHFTPKCIARLLGWSSEEINSPDNKQWLSFACHSAKDLTTHNRFKLLIAQLSRDQKTNIHHIQVWSKRENRVIQKASVVNEKFVDLLTLYITKNGKEKLNHEVVEDLWGMAAS